MIHIVGASPATTIRNRLVRGASFAAAAVLAISLTACGGDSGSGETPTTGSGAGSGSAAPPEEFDSLDVLLGFKYSTVQWYSLYHYGEEEGFFAKYGVDPTFLEGPGSANAIQLIAQGNSDVGAAISTASVLQAVSEGADVKMVAAETPVGTISVLSKGDNPIETPDDLEGKKIGYDPASYAGVLFGALLEVNDIPAAAVTQVSVQGSAYVPALASGQIDGYLSAPDTNVPLLEAQGIDPTVLNFGDYGVDASPQEGVIATPEALATKGDIIRRFLQGLNDTIDALRDNPEAIADAAAAGAKAKPGVVDEDVAEQQIRLHIDGLPEPAKDHSNLWIDESSVGNLLDLLSDNGQIPADKVLPVDEYFTNDYLDR